MLVVVVGGGMVVCFFFFGGGGVDVHKSFDLDYTDLTYL